MTCWHLSIERTSVFIILYPAIRDIRLNGFIADFNNFSDRSNSARAGALDLKNIMASFTSFLTVIHF